MYIRSPYMIEEHTSIYSAEVSGLENLELCSGDHNTIPQHFHSQMLLRLLEEATTRKHVYKVCNRHHKYVILGL